MGLTVKLNHNLAVQYLTNHGCRIFTLDGVRPKLQYLQAMGVLSSDSKFSSETHRVIFQVGLSITVLDNLKKKKKTCRNICYILFIFTG